MVETPDKDDNPDLEHFEPATADIELTEQEINLLAETLPKIIVEERQLDARNALLKTGRDQVLESVQEKLEATEPNRQNDDLPSIEKIEPDE